MSEFWDTPGFFLTALPGSIMGHDKRSTRPFTHLQKDVVEPLPQSEGYEYLLVCIDRCRGATADVVAKVSYTHIWPRWEFPLQIDRDQGSHFTGQVLKVILEKYRNETKTIYSLSATKHRGMLKVITEFSKQVLEQDGGN